MMSGDASWLRSSDHGMDPNRRRKALAPNITVLDTNTPNRLTMPELNTICTDIITVNSRTKTSPQRIVASSEGAEEQMATTQPPSDSRIPRHFWTVIRSCPESTLNPAVQEGRRP